VLASHFGRPKGTPDHKYSLKPVAERLAELVGRPVRFAPDCIGPETQSIVKSTRPGEIVLLENLRFHAGEEANDPVFSRALALMVDLYVNDAFGTAHRAHASTEGMARIFPMPAAGLLMEKEIAFLSRVLENPAQPAVAIIGGGKVSDKLGVIRNLLPKVDTLLVGGGLVFNFLKAKGLEIGRSVWQEKMLGESKALLSEPKLRLPEDIRIGSTADKTAQVKNVPADAIPADWHGLDIGDAAAAAYAGIVTRARTIIWAGPLGMCELDEFAVGTQTVAQAVAEATARGAVSVVGGGDTGAALGKFGLKKQVSHVSTGGSACLEFLEGRQLPGISVLKDRA
jgi:phosphoglycerate kinase